MPLAVRYIEPKHLWRKPLPSGVKNELQGIAALSLCGVIRQISSLAKHAESVLGELCDSLAEYHSRTVQLDARVSRLRDNILPKMDIDKEVRVSLVEYLQGDSFRSDHVITQQILSLKTAPEALISQYECTDPKPQLHYFTSLADDGRDAMHLYSNPDFFFNHWRQSMEREALRRRHLDSMLEESTEIIRLQVPSTHHQKGSNNSSTLPVRVKSRKRSMPAVIQVFNSVRDKKGQKKRLAVTNDTFVHSYDRSESSGYLSQHSSYNSLLDHDSTGSMGSQDPRFLSCSSLPVQNGVLPNGFSQNSDETPVTNHSTSIPNSLSQPLAINERQQSVTSHKLNSIDVHTSSSVHSFNNGTNEETQPKVLNRTKSSSKADKHNWHNEPYSSTSDSNSPQSSGRDTVTPPLSKYPIRKGSLPVETNISPNHRKGSLQGSLTPTQLSPKVSPDIRRRVESITKQISSCNGHIPTSGVFRFPDPVEVLGPNWNPGSHIGRNKSMDDLSPEDFPPIDPQLVDQANHAYLNQTRPSNQISSPQSPQRRILEGLPKSTRRPAPTPPQSRSRIHSQGSTPEQLSSPLMRRQSSSESSPITPKRKAPQPPNQKGLWSRSSSSEDPLEVKTPVIEKRKLFSRQKSETETVLVSQTKTETQPRNTTETRDHTQSSEVQPKGPDKSGVKSKQKVAPVFRKQKSEEKRKKSADQILMSSGVNAGLSNERSDLLVAIRKGIQLKNVKKEEQRKKQHSSAMPWDVAAILERRYALEISDNENEEGAVQDAEWEDL